MVHSIIDEISSMEFPESVNCVEFVRLVLEKFLGLEIKRKEEPNFKGDANNHITCFPQFSIEYDGPFDWDVVLMTRVHGRNILNAGHCGVFLKGYVLHLEEGFGVICQKFEDRKIKRRFTGIVRYDKNKA